MSDEVAQFEGPIDLGRASVGTIRARAEAAFSTLELDTLEYRPLQVSVRNLEGKEAVPCNSNAMFGQAVYLETVLRKERLALAVSRSRLERARKNLADMQEQLRLGRRMMAFDTAKLSVCEDAERRL